LRNQLVIGISLLTTLGLVFFMQHSSSLPNLAYDPGRFVFKTLCSQLNEPIELEIFNNGDVLLIERRGYLKLYKEADHSIQSVGKIPVGYGLETGLLGLALDPDFVRNNWIYLFYTDPISRSAQRVARFDFQNNQLVNESEKILLEIPFDTISCCHHGGALEFGPDKNLFISTGDNTTPTNFAFDERPENRHYDAQRTSANTQDLRGKILRIKPTPEGSYTIPPGNLFDPNTAKAKPEIYVMGTRNPFRISVDQKTGWLFWGDVGPNPGKYDPRRGPNTHEEFNVATAPGNFGWPYLLGDNQAFTEFDFTTKQRGALFDPLNLKNDSPNNNGISNLPPAKPALIWYPTEVSSTFPALGSGGGSAMTGPVFNFDVTSKKNIQFPDFFDKKLFVFDWMRSWIMAVELDSAGQYIGMQDIFPDRPFIKPIQIKFGPNGAMYVLDYGSNWYTQNADAGITKIIYQRGNRPPIAKISTQKHQQAAPFHFTASAEKSYDPDQEKELSYEWKIEDTVVGCKQQFTQIFKEIGIYQIVLKVKDQAGAFHQDSLTVFVGNNSPEIAMTLFPDHGFYESGKPLSYNVKVTDTEDGLIIKNKIQTQLTSLDKGISLPGLKGDQAAVAIPIKQHFYPGEVLIQESDCRACHAIKDNSVGPSWKQIAEFYANQPEVHLSIAKKIINGGEGVWGDKIMSAHPQFSEEEAMDMIRYILSFDTPITSKADTLYLPPAGTIDFDTPKITNGRFVLQAYYTDQGANKMPRIQATKTIVLRPRKLGPDQFDFYHHTSVSTDKVSKTRKAVVGHNGGYIGFEKLNLKDIPFIKVRLRTNATLIKVEAHLDSPTGSIIGTTQKKLPEISPYPSITKMEWLDLQVPIQIDSRQSKNVYLVFYTNKKQSVRTYQSIAEIQKITFGTMND